jgi:exonuclease III
MVSHELKIMSLNVNGPNSPKKRGLVLTKLKKEKQNVIFLQETHLCQTEHEKFKKLGYKNSYYSTYKQSRKRGVMILIPNSTTFVSEKVIKDEEGRYVIVKG